MSTDPSLPRLSDQQLRALRDRARAEAHAQFVNPSLARTATPLRTYPRSWTAFLLGDDPDDNWENRLLMLFACREYPHFVAAHMIAQDTTTARNATDAATESAREAADAQASARDAAMAEWEKVRALLPVPVFVGHNWTLGHYEGHNTGRDHIVAQEAFVLGRWRRGERQAFCEVGRRMNSGHLRNLDRSPDVVPDGTDRERVPTCTECVRVACRLATFNTTTPATPTVKEHHP